MPFPRFEDGDVEIRLTEQDESFVLHSYVLALHSPWFKASLSERWNQGEAAAPGARRLYELRFEKDAGTGALMRSTGVGDMEILQSTMNQSTEPARTEDVRAQRIRIADAHQSMLGALYHVVPAFGLAWNDPSGKALSNFALVSEYYGCEQLTRVFVHEFLSRNRDGVLLQCETKPYTMVKIGAMVEADWIVKESAVHIICRDSGRRDPADSDKTGRFAGLFALLQGKREQLIQQLKDAELKLFHSNRTFLSDTHNQLALDCLRQYLSDCGPGYELRPGYAKVWRQISGGDTPFELTDVLIKKHFGNLSRDSDGDFISHSKIREEWVDLFSDSRYIIEPLLTDRTQSKSATISTSNLRCMTIEDDELPWKQRT